MAIAYVTKSTGSTTGGSSLTVSGVACGTAADTVVIGLFIGYSGSANTISNMSVNGDTSATTAHADQDWSGANNTAKLFYWVGTGPGTVDVVFSWTGSMSGCSAVVLVYSGATGLANISADIGGSGTTSLSKTVTSATDDLALTAWLCETTANTFTAGSGGTERADETVGGFRYYISEEAGASSVTVDGTTSGTVYRNVTYGFSITAAAGGGGGSAIAVISHYYRMMSQ